VNNYIGEQFNQYGDHNIGKIDARNSAYSSFSSTELRVATIELAGLIRSLERAGLVSPDGGITDERAAAAVVQAHRPRLGKVAALLAAGGRKALSSSFDHVLTPLALALVEKYTGLH
jgi:hypothetical protein